MPCQQENSTLPPRLLRLGLTILSPDPEHSLGSKQGLKLGLAPTEARGSPHTHLDELRVFPLLFLSVDTSTLSEEATSLVGTHHDR